MVSGGFARIRLRPSRKGKPRTVAENNRRLRAGARTTDLAFRAGGQPPRTAENRPRIYGMAGRERRSVQHRFHQGRQTRAGEIAAKRGSVQTKTAGNVGRTSARFRYFV